jgi:hypothetical protein
MQIIWSVDISVKRLSCVSKTTPADQAFVRYWHTEQRPLRSYILFLCQSYPGTTAYLIAAERNGGEVWLAASCTHALLCSITSTTHPPVMHPTVLIASKNLRVEVFGQSARQRSECWTPRKLVWTVERCNDNRILTIQYDISPRLKNQACWDVTPFRPVVTDISKQRDAFGAKQFKNL